MNFVYIMFRHSFGVLVVLVINDLLSLMILILFMNNIY